MRSFLVYIFLITVSLSVLFAKNGTTVYVNDNSDAEFDRLVIALENSTLEDRITAAFKLRFFISKLAVRPLANILPSKKPVENDPYLKYVLTKSLGYIGRDEAIPYLVKAYKELQSGIDEKEKPQFSDVTKFTMVVPVGEMLRTLGFLSFDEEAYSTLKEALKHKNSYIRASAADGMKMYKKSEHVASLIETLKEEKDLMARTSMLNAIVYIQRVSDSYFYEILEMLKNDDPLIRQRASIALGEVDLRAAELPMIRAIQIEESSLVREQMMEDLKIIQTFKIPDASALSNSGQ